MIKHLTPLERIDILEPAFESALAIIRAIDTMECFGDLHPSDEINSKQTTGRYLIELLRERLEADASKLKAREVRHGRT